MTDTEKEALCTRIDKLCAELSRSQLNHDMWHDRAETMRNRLSAVQAENERLRNQLRDQQDTAEHNLVRNAREYKRVCDENAKLRELVGMMAKAIGVTADKCRGDCIGPYECTLDGGCPIQKLMRELGIEVGA